MFTADAHTNSETIFTPTPAPLLPLFTVAVYNGFETIEHHNLTEVEATALCIAIDEANYPGANYPHVMPQDEVLLTDWYTLSAVAGFAHDSQYVQAALIQMQERDEIEARKAEQLAYDRAHYAELINRTDRANDEVQKQYDLIAELELKAERATAALDELKDERNRLEARMWAVQTAPGIY